MSQGFIALYTSPRTYKQSILLQSQGESQDAQRPSTLDLDMGASPSMAKHPPPPNSAEFQKYRDPEPATLRQTRETKDYQ